MLRNHKGIALNNLYVKDNNVFYQVYWTHDGVAFYEITDWVLTPVTSASSVYARYTGDIHKPPPATALPWKKKAPLERSKLRHEQHLK